MGQVAPPAVGLAVIKPRSEPSGYRHSVQRSKGFAMSSARPRPRPRLVIRPELRNNDRQDHLHCSNRTYVAALNMLKNDMKPKIIRESLKWEVATLPPAKTERSSRQGSSRGGPIWERGETSLEICVTQCPGMLQLCWRPRKAQPNNRDGINNNWPISGPNIGSPLG